jgi:hypothetical protein
MIDGEGLERAGVRAGSKRKMDLVLLSRRMTMTSSAMPSIVQAIGLSCIPYPDGPAGVPALARQPVAAAIVTIQQREDGHRECVATRLSDARDNEFPLSWLIDQALAPGAIRVATPKDRVILTVDGAARRFFVETRLAALCRGEDVIDPLQLPDGTVDEMGLLRRWDIPIAPGDEETARHWSRHTPRFAEEAALVAAIGRLMLWAHQASSGSGCPDIFFETLLPLRDWALVEEERSPVLRSVTSARPVLRAASLAHQYRDHCMRQAAGDQGTWISFEDGLFHT